MVISSMSDDLNSFWLKNKVITFIGAASSPIILVKQSEGCKCNVDLLWPGSTVNSYIHRAITYTHYYYVLILKSIPDYILEVHTVYYLA